MSKKDETPALEMVETPKKVEAPRMVEVPEHVYNAMLEEIKMKNPVRTR